MAESRKSPLPSVCGQANPRVLQCRGIEMGPRSAIGDLHKAGGITHRRLIPRFSWPEDCLSPHVRSTPSWSSYMCIQHASCMAGWLNVPHRSPAAKQMLGVTNGGGGWKPATDRDNERMPATRADDDHLHPALDSNCDWPFRRCAASMKLCCHGLHNLSTNSSVGAGAVLENAVARSTELGSQRANLQHPL